MSTAYLLPVANGSYTQFALSGCAAAWQCVDDPVGSPDDSTTYLSAANSTKRQSVVVAEYNNGHTIHSITVHARIAQVFFAGTGYLLVRIGGVDYESAGKVLPRDDSGTFSDYSETWTTNPATGLAWTFTDLAALEIGLRAVQVAISTTRLTQIYVAVDYDAPRADLEPLAFYLCPQPATTIFTGRVASTPTDPYMTIAYNTGVTGSFGAPLPGQTVHFGSTAGGKERGVRRLRSWSGGGTLSVDESDDTGPLIQANDYITIKWDFRLWPKYPRFVQVGENVTAYEDYDTAYNNQTLDWYPVAVAGPPGAAFIEAGQAQISFVGDQSRAMAPGATLTNYLWTAYDSVEGTSISQGTEASPVTFTWAGAGWHLVSLRVTDSNGNSHTAYTWAIAIDPDSPEDVAFIDFDAVNDNQDRSQGGGSLSCAVRGTNANTTVFPEECLIVHIARGDMITPTGSWPHRTNILFVGYVVGGSVRQNPDTSEVSFRAATVDAVMKNTSVYPPSLKFVSAPASWLEAAQLDTARALSYMYKWRSTLDTMTPVILPTYAGLISRQDFGKDRLFDRVQSELMRSIWGQVAATHQGVLYHEIDYNLMNAAERAAVTTRKVLHKGVWVGDVTIEERSNYEWTANQVEMSGVAYSGGDIEEICPLFSQAPGDATKVYGAQLVYDSLILLSQDDLNVRCGHALAKANVSPTVYRMQFINDGSFTLRQEKFPAVIEAGDNNRGLSYNGNLIPRRISRQYNHEGGYYTVSVDFEPEVSGTPGTTVEVDCSPPAQKLSTLAPVPLSDGGPVALIAGTTGTSFYFEPGPTQTWQRRVTGLADPAQIGFLDVIPDPWSSFKQGYSPEKTIVWGAGRGFLVRSVDSGTTWKDRTGYVDAPAWAGETGTVINSVDLIRLQGDIFSENRLFILARWQYGGNYHGAVYKTTDGFDFAAHNITGSSQVRPLGMSLDRGNGGTLYVTTWESEPTGTIYLRAYNTSDMTLSRRVSLGTASSAEIDAQSRYANPFNRLGAADEVYIYGNMDRPQGSTGTVHILKNIGGGATGSYSVIENGWSTDACGTFGADENGNLYAVRQTP